MPDLEKMMLPAGVAQTTRIGFGCSNLLGDKTHAAGLELLHAAYDGGIRHFDVARVYNFGDAEAMVGEFAAGKRDTITLTTKFGKMPRGGVARMKGPVQLARRVMRSSAWLRKLIRRNLSNLTQGSQFDPASAKLSLDASLQALKTDYLDLFLLHEGTVADCTDEMLTFLQRAREGGKILAFGCGSGYHSIPTIANGRPDFLGVAQFESSLADRNIEAFGAIRPPQTQLVSTHGALGAAAAMKHHLAANPPLAMRWSDTLGVDLTGGPGLYGLLLRHALVANPGGLVLFRASTPERLRATLAATERVTLDGGSEFTLREMTEFFATTEKGGAHAKA